MLPALATWARSDAYAWALTQNSKALRLLDRLPDVFEAVSVGLNGVQGDEPGGKQIQCRRCRVHTATHTATHTAKLQ